MMLQKADQDTLSTPEAIRNAASIAALSFLLSIVGYISYISPPLGDMWGYIVVAADNSPWDLVGRYFQGYMGNNPRIGQYVLSLAGYGKVATALANSVSLAMVLFGGFVVATGKTINPLRPSHAALVLIIFGSLVAAGSEIGQALFYTPFTANYVFGFGLLLVFLAIVRTCGSNSNRLGHFVVMTVGFLAGLTNEHTPPFFLVIGLFAIFAHFLNVAKLRLRPFHYIAYFAFFVGYAALYFAPGQNARYGDAVGKTEGFEAMLADLPARFDSVFSKLLANSSPYFLMAFALGGLVTYVCWHRNELKQVAWPWIMLASSIGIALTVMASPLVGQRLLFASYAALAISLAGWLWNLRNIKLIYIVGTLLATASGLIFSAKSLTIYRDLASSYSAHETEIAAAKRSGEEHPVFDIYYGEFRAHREYLRNEYFSSDPDHRLNRLRAKIYGFSSFSFYLPVE